MLNYLKSKLVMTKRARINLMNKLFTIGIVTAIIVIYMVLGVIMFMHMNTAY